MAVDTETIQNFIAAQVEKAAEDIVGRVIQHYEERITKLEGGQAGIELVLGAHKEAIEEHTRNIGQIADVLYKRATSQPVPEPQPAAPPTKGKISREAE